MNVAELNRLLANLFTIGTVFDIAVSPLRVRVAIATENSTQTLETDWLACVQPAAGGVRQWSPPGLGEQVMVFSPSGELGNGLVLRGIASAGNPSPSDNLGETLTQYPDGALVSYNHESGELLAMGVKSAVIQGSGKATIDFPNIEAKGDVHITGDLIVDGHLTYKSGMSGSGGEGGGKTVITGDFTQQDGKLSSNGVVLDEHIHDGVERGGDSTGGPK